MAFGGVFPGQCDAGHAQMLQNASGEGVLVVQRQSSAVCRKQRDIPHGHGDIPRKAKAVALRGRWVFELGHARKEAWERNKNKRASLPARTR